MRKCIFLSGVLALLFIAATPLLAIDAGPGGRIYITGRGDDNGTSGIYLYSLAIDQNWDNESFAMVDHGFIRDAIPNDSKRRLGSSPEIVQNGGEGYGSLVLGANYNTSPAGQCEYLSNGYATETMDVLEVTPNDTGTDITVLSDGKAIDSTSGQCWDHRDDTTTEAGRFAIPDPVGDFTKTGDAVVLSAGVNSQRIWVNSDASGDGDIASEDVDYGSMCDQGMGTLGDQELVGNRLYMTSGWGVNMGSGGGEDGIFYYQREDDNSITRHGFYWDNGGECTNGGPVDISEGALAVGTVKDAAGNSHAAAWAGTHDSDCGTWGTSFIGLFVDWNDDGDAMDNAEVTGIADEYQEWAFHGSDTSYNWDGISTVTLSDLEYVENDNGTKFLMVVDGNANAWGVGQAVYVLQLDDNGTYVGGDDGAKLIFKTTLREDPKTPTGWSLPGTSDFELEFDPNQPVTVTPGDANGDGKIDGGDLALWQQNYDPLGTAGNATFAMGDFNGDGKIDGGDLAIWQQNYNPLGTAGAAGASSVPEPATLLLLGSGLLGAIGAIRRRRS